MVINHQNQISSNRIAVIFELMNGMSYPHFSAAHDLKTGVLITIKTITRIQVYLVIFDKIVVYDTNELEQLPEGQNRNTNVI